MHTTRDAVNLRTVGITPDRTQPREHPVPCLRCQVKTWNLAGFCDAHYQLPGQCVS